MWAGRCFLGTWSVCVLLAAIFAADPPGHWDRPPSTSAVIRGGAAMSALFLALPIAAWLLSRSFRRDPWWHWLSGLYVSLAGAMVASLVAFSVAPVFVTDGPPRLLGLTERILLAVNSAWLCVLAFGLLKHPGSNLAAECEPVCMSPLARERIPLPSCFGVVGPKRATTRQK